MATNRVRIPKASDVVIAEIRERILFHRLPVGTRLPNETELMEQYGLGRVTVREALRVLERDGLVEIRRGPTGGIFVRHTDISQVSDAMAMLFRFSDTTLGEASEFRSLLEPRVARLAAINATEVQLEQIAKIANGDFDAVRLAEFHALLTAACGNKVFEMTLKALHDSAAGHYRYDLIESELPDGGTHDHVEIAKAIVARDADAAEDAMRRHLATYDQYLRDNHIDGVPTIPEKTAATTR
ncbi:FadR/GntR family transcriptional regulator [Aeromicrobium endophyticum]|uniref:FadR family transcriptional regulator n=1 Tax=Aeromicrobium endophyticum TaxID=2292704 RepID=A0A371PBT4_9ACTN|nr:FCD domain-containing protein [Aeromicrobium endophyticum]REK73347.1 FadR family transcriptional regulator [Aeromicrobium endophyticum]